MSNPEAFTKNSVNRSKKKSPNLNTLKISFPVVGIGASAGGLEAISELLRFLPSDTGMAFVCIQHLDPKHESLLTSILAKATSMEVLEVVNGMQVKPNGVYVIPPNTCMTILTDVLKLEPRSISQCESHKPIDIFFKSLAKARGSQAIGVVLSGTASDGSAGIVALKEAGGITIAQDENSAKFQQMPHNAIATDCIDFVLNPKKMAEMLGTISRYPYTSPSESEIQKLHPETDEGFHQIVLLLKKKSGVDFLNYKPATLMRRVVRRMIINRKSTLQDYFTILKNNPQELEALQQDVLIKVTRFFRDPEIFKLLQKEVFPLMVKNKSHEHPLRIWVPACSSGEEIYSLAMALLEFLGDTAEDIPIQFFGSDIKESCIAAARTGIYPESIAQDVSPERLKRFFNKVDRGYQITKSIRDCCVFAKQNVTSDPPFSRMDLISCRNLLIYFTTALQSIAIPTFHYALNPDGFLLLGPSESAMGFKDLFKSFNEKAKIYSKKNVPGRYVFGRVSSPYVPEKMPIGRKPDSKEVSPGLLNVQREADRVIVAKYEQAGVVINEAMEIVQFRGDTSDYLKSAAGAPSSSLFKMVREGLHTELRMALEKVMKKGGGFKKENIQIKIHKDYKSITFEIIPLKVPASHQRHFLILFSESPVLTPLHPAGKPRSPSKAKPGSRERELEDELMRVKAERLATKNHMQTIIAEWETANTELQTANEEVVSSNEELQSLNEEMQSANEELQTAKEEIQASNEEITTVNDELNDRNLQLTQLNDDFANLTKSIQLPVVIVRSDFRIRFFTKASEKVLSLVETDIGRSINDIKLRAKIPNLEELISQVIKDLAIQEQEVQDEKGHWYNLQIRPYQATGNKIDGVVLTFVDIDALKKNQSLIEDYMRFLQAMIQTADVPLVVLDSQLRVKMVNESFCRTFQVEASQAENRLIYELSNKQWNIPELRKLLENILPNKSKLLNYEVERDFETIGHKIMMINASQIESKQSILLSIKDITEYRAMERGLKDLNVDLEKKRLKLAASNTELEEFAAVASHDLQEPFHVISMFLGILGSSYKDKLEPKAQELIKIAGDAAGQAQSLIRGLLDYARVDAKDETLTMVDSKSIVRSVLSEQMSQIEESSAEIICDSLPEILGEPLHLKRLFQNLISNAIKYRSARPLKVWISARKENDGWVFQVKDNGIGFDPKENARIFEMFKRLQGWEMPGVGIGLATCKKIVERHGGKIWAESKPDKGASFYFSIPNRKYPPPRKKAGRMRKPLESK